MNIPIIHIPSAEYHAESRNGRYLSSHLLADFRQSPNSITARSAVKSPVRRHRRWHWGAPPTASSSKAAWLLTTSSSSATAP